MAGNSTYNTLMAFKSLQSTIEVTRDEPEQNPGRAPHRLQNAEIPLSGSEWLSMTALPMLSGIGAYYLSDPNAPDRHGFPYGFFAGTVAMLATAVATMTTAIVRRL